MTLDQIQEMFDSALKSDLENGVKWVNEMVAEEFKTKYPELNKALSTLMGLEDENS